MIFPSAEIAVAHKNSSGVWAVQRSRPLCKSIKVRRPPGAANAAKRASELRANAIGGSNPKRWAGNVVSTVISGNLKSVMRLSTVAAASVLPSPEKARALQQALKGISLPNCWRVAESQSRRPELQLVGEVRVAAVNTRVGLVGQKAQMASPSPSFHSVTSCL